jgi:uncharacterized protein
MTSEIQPRLDALRRIIAGYESCLVAYSGGVDSALVLAIAHEQLGDRAVGCIGVSPSFPRREREAAVELARKIGAHYRFIEPGEHLQSDYSANTDTRCFFCKSALFTALSEIAASEGWSTIADGTHADDALDHANGIRAASERAVRSPLTEAHFTKRDVRLAAHALNLPVWDKPAVACLASRVPHGTPITAALLKQIERAEDACAAAGLRQFRVRHHGEIARLELSAVDFPRAIERREQLVKEIRAAGYR